MRGENQDLADLAVSPGQVAEKENLGQIGKKIDDQQQRKHFESWESYWGRPGNGAPRNVAHKENLIKMLHFPAATEKVTGAAEYSPC